MLDEYFAEQMKYIVLNSVRKPDRECFFSATMNEQVKNLAISLDKLIKIFINNDQDVAFNLHQEFIR